MNGRLRFFRHDDPDAVSFELAGALCGADVETLYQAWQQEAWVDALRPVIVDITFITEADQHGRALLVVMHRFGTQIIAKSPESFAIVQQCLANMIAPPVSMSGWFTRLIGFIRSDRPAMATFPLRAHLISRASSGQELVNQEA